MFLPKSKLGTYMNIVQDKNEHRSQREQ